MEVSSTYAWKGTPTLSGRKPHFTNFTSSVSRSRLLFYKRINLRVAHVSVFLLASNRIRRYISWCQSLVFLIYFLVARTLTSKNRDYSKKTYSKREKPFSTVSYRVQSFAGSLIYSLYHFIVYIYGFFVVQSHLRVLSDPSATYLGSVDRFNTIASL